MQVKHNKIYYGVMSQMNDNMFRPFFWTRPSSGHNIVVEEEFTEYNNVNTQFCCVWLASLHVIVILMIVHTTGMNHLKMEPYCSRYETEEDGYRCFLNNL